MLGFSHAAASLFCCACQKPSGLTMALLSSKRKKKKGTFLAGMKSKLEVNY